MDEKTKRTLEAIFWAGLKAVDPEEAIRRHVQLTADHLKVGEHAYPLASYDRIVVTGFGKGTAPMAKALEEILGDRLTEDWITVKYGHGLPLKKVRVMEAGHPIPDQAGLQATRFILDRLKGCTANDLVLCAFSGGGSALSPAPRAHLELGEKQETTQLLLNCGATIFEINAMRKHLSLCKGGGNWPESHFLPHLFPCSFRMWWVTPSMSSHQVPRLPTRVHFLIASALSTGMGFWKNYHQRCSSCCKRGPTG